MNQNKKRTKWCPWNGCGMPNGAAMPVPVKCLNCECECTNVHKICPNCHSCLSCGRIGKKFFVKGQGENNL